jgi:hypothetical protein
MVLHASDREDALNRLRSPDDREVEPVLARQRVDLEDQSQPGAVDEPQLTQVERNRPLGVGQRAERASTSPTVARSSSPAISTTADARPCLTSHRNGSGLEPIRVQSLGRARSYPASSAGPSVLGEMARMHAVGVLPGGKSTSGGRGRSPASASHAEFARKRRSVRAVNQWAAAQDRRGRRRGRVAHRRRSAPALVAPPWCRARRRSYGGWCGPPC